MRNTASSLLRYCLLVRLLAALGLFLLAACSFADRIILTPTGSKIPFQALRFEYMFDVSPTNQYRAYLGYGLTKDIDVEFLLDRFRQDASVGSLNLSYNYLPPIVDTAPGLSVGVKDAMNRTEDGRLIYLAMTYKMGLSSPAQGTAPLEITVGGGVGTKRSGLFTGIVLPITWRLKGLAEHDMQRVTAGLEYQPFQGFGVRWMFRQHESLFSARYTIRF